MTIWKTCNSEDYQCILNFLRQRNKNPSQDYYEHFNRQELLEDKKIYEKIYFLIRTDIKKIETQLNDISLIQELNHYVQIEMAMIERKIEIL